MATMTEQQPKLHIFFFPLIAHGHMLPMFDIARLFACRGAKSTFITTPPNAPLFSDKIHRDRSLLGLDIQIQTIHFPYAQVGLPESFSSSKSITSPEMADKFVKAFSLFDRQLEQLLQQHRPHCLVADMFFPWATDLAAKFGIPRLVFHGTAYFALCVEHSLSAYKPQNKVPSEEAFVVPGLPDEIEMKSSQLPQYALTPSPVHELLTQIKESEVKSYGVLVNSFYDLEPNYVDYYKKKLGRKAWHIGPLSLACNTTPIDKAQRGEKPDVDENRCSNWLDQKAPNTVLYVCFGTLTRLPNTQLAEIALALEASQFPFIWVVNKSNDQHNNISLPEGFEERMESTKQGLIIKGWAPQVLILDHPSVGGFMSHCGWNSVQEGVSAGVPLITWPLIAEQFYNEKLVTQVVRVGVGVGVEKWNAWPEMVESWVGRERIVEAVDRVMGCGEEAVEIRERVRGLSVKARRAVGEGGSSFTEFTDLMEGLIAYKGGGVISSSSMATEVHQLHVFFFPFLAHGHMIPTLDIARLFAARGAKSTIITTAGNATGFTSNLDRERCSGHDININIKLIRFPSTEVGLDEGCESFHSLTTMEMLQAFLKATSMLQTQIEELLVEYHPDCIVADMCFPWVSDIAAKLEIPHIIFHGWSYFALCAMDLAATMDIPSDSESFVALHLPDEITMKRSKFPPDYYLELQTLKWLQALRESELRSYGVIVNSFKELEPAYAEFHKKVMKRKAWHIGPVSFMCNKNTTDKAHRGEKANIDENYCLNWLDGKAPDSVLYVSFGSLARFSTSQLVEIAGALEASGVSFIWVIRSNENEEPCLPQSLEGRLAENGLIVKGWAPQLLILDHQAIGGFMTHCGWNSIIEGITAGVPFITWPLFADQFYNEELVTTVLRVGIRIGVEVYWTLLLDEMHTLKERERIEVAVNQLMSSGEEALEIRKRAKELGRRAKAAVEDGGSSRFDFNALIEELSTCKQD
ncbi:hypothetical protein Sjap_022842 [Stephania japonica]|uniref:Uncharacterized protein n=1 Tax=Stephania japonica TaxID=461633 RepID=A0AAP0EPM1_9MAGN